jgi:hypothetical protein
MKEVYWTTNNGSVISVTHHLAPGKPIAIDGTPAGTLLGIFRNDEELVEHLRRRAAQAERRGVASGAANRASASAISSQSPASVRGSFANRGWSASAQYGAEAKSFRLQHRWAR